MEIANPNLLLKPGMQAVTKCSIQEGLFIPIDVIREENHKYIWVEKSHGLLRT
jgi:Cu(I)/Ag(I) efflux system membrane fusion protein